MMVKLPTRQLLWIFIAITVIIILRLGYLQIVQYGYYKDKRNSHLAVIQTIYGNRGEIYDRNGLVLATDRDSISIYANSTGSYKQNSAEKLKKLADIIDINYDTLITKLPKQENRFIWLRRGIDISKQNQIRELKLVGIGMLKEKSRFYPNSLSLQNLLGFTDTDNNGIEGLELSYNKEIAGANGKIYLEFDNDGELVVSEKRIIKEPIDGKPISTTIDMRLQVMLERYLMEGLRKSNAKRGGAIVMNIETGEILAMGQVPQVGRESFTSQNRDIWGNWLIGDLYEPGSTLKPLTIGLALDAYKVGQNTLFEDNGSLTVDNKIIRNYDSDEKIHGLITPADILKYSSNVGAAQVGLLFTPSEYRQKLINAGFGDRTNIDIAGETPPSNPKKLTINKVELSNIAFGQGIALTPIKLVYLFSEIISDNPVPNPHVKKADNAAKQNLTAGNLILNGDTKKLLRKMLENVVENGTGRAAYIDRYSIGGKTGTAQKVNFNTKTYQENSFICSFVAFTPASKPKYIVLVIYDEPKYPYNTGGILCAPVAKDIMKTMIRLYHLPPDKAG
jgi:cell division protein FtsI/penicillin-binding protein 2